MEIKKPRSRLRLSFRVLKLRFFVLLCALAGVIFLSRSLQSTEFRDFLSQLFSSGRSWNWCPPSTNQVQLLGTEQIFKTASEIQNLCLVQMEPFEMNVSESLQFQPVLRAANAQGQEALMEGDLSKGLFRAQGLPFRSEALSATLRRIGRP